jgi:hypothetical protein
MRQELIREMMTTIQRGGGVPFTGELRQIQYSDAHAVGNVPFPRTVRRLVADGAAHAT